MSSYNVRSPRADEFINHEEIFDTLAYAEAHKNDAALARSILEKARANLTPAHDHGTTLTHREASVLLACEDPEVNAEIRQLARDIKQAYYGNRIVLFAPLYLSNYCVNGCLYCPYHAKNRDIPRRKLTQEEIRAEVVALQGDVQVLPFQAWGSAEGLRAHRPEDGGDIFHRHLCLVLFDKDAHLCRVGL